MPQVTLEVHYNLTTFLSKLDRSVSILYFSSIKYFWNLVFRLFTDVIAKYVLMAEMPMEIKVPFTRELNHI